MMKVPYPIILNLTDKNVAVVGGGHVAYRKLKKLIAAGVHPTVIAPVLFSKIPTDRIKWIRDQYKRAYVQKMDVIIACTNDQKVNTQVKEDASHFQLVNNTSDKNNSDFYNLATVSADDLFISVSTMGKSPARAKQMKKEIKAWIQGKFHKGLG